MKKKYLLDLGLDDETVQAVLTESKRDIERLEAKMRKDMDNAVLENAKEMESMRDIHAAELAALEAMGIETDTVAAGDDAEKITEDTARQTDENTEQEGNGERSRPVLVIPPCGGVNIGAAGQLPRVL